MEKYLFNDGTNGIREVQSREELESLISTTPDPDRIRIWVFNTSEWVSYTAFTRTLPVAAQQPMPSRPPSTATTAVNSRGAKKTGWIKKTVFAVAAVAAIFLVYNFTKLRWLKLAPVEIAAARPDNVPPVNADSLIQSIESTRGQKLDKITRTNLRIRNTWPERILLKLNASRDSSNVATRFHEIELVLDNATGYQLDDAVVELRVWKNQEIIQKDTFLFQQVSYALPARKLISNEYKGDSLSISFRSIKAKSFNFCYADDKQSNYGNMNDRWFCK